MLVLSRYPGEQIVLPSLGITVSVELVRGTRVMIGVDAPSRISIRRAELPPEAMPGDGPKPDLKSDLDSQPSPFTILLAARPSLTRHDFRAALAGRGCDVRIADNGLQCVEMLRKSLPDVLVIELELPWGGGDGVLDLIHEQLEQCRVPVFVLSGEQSRSQMYRISRFTISDFAIRPLAAKQLADRVARLVARRPAGGARDLQVARPHIHPRRDV